MEIDWRAYAQRLLVLGCALALVGCGWMKSGDGGIVEVRAVPPTIVKQPVSTTVEAGTAATFTVEATGDETLTYQWYRNGDAIEGATTATYTIPAVRRPEDDGVSIVVVVTSRGSAFTKSDEAFLSVVETAVAPTITLGPDARMVMEGTEVTWTVSATGTQPLSFQWRLDDADIPGATGEAFKRVALLADDGKSVSVHVSNRAGATTSARVRLSVSAKPVAPVVTTPPAAQTVVDGGRATFTVVAMGTGALAYQWMLNGTAVPGATANTYAIDPVSKSLHDGAQISVRVANAVGDATSAPVTLTVAPAAPMVTVAPADIVVRHGKTAQLAVTATGTPPLQYQWLRNGVEVAGATNATLPVTATWADNGARYSVRVSNTSPTPVTSTEAEVTVLASAAGSAGWAHSHLLVNGQVYSFGTNLNGALGLGSAAPASHVPTRIPGLSDVAQLDAGQGFSLAVTSNGSVYGWGSNACGQLGDGTTTSRATPQQLQVPTPAVQVTAAYCHALILDANGRVFAMGDNNNGQLGLGTTTAVRTPTEITGLSGIRQIHSAVWHTLALDTEGRVWAWGRASGREIGGASTAPWVLSPAPVPELSNIPVIQIVTGTGFSLALAADGRVYFSGSVEASRSDTFTAIPNLSDVVEIAAGNDTAYALARDGTLFAWGGGSGGQIGENAHLARATPTRVRINEAVASVFAGGHSAFAVIKQDGSVRAWGNNYQGQVGQPNFNVYPATPTHIQGTPIQPQP